jgi:outer membrane protein assembly complex protein YaeT
LLLLSSLPAAAKDDSAELKVSGYGLLGNLKLKHFLKLLRAEKTNQFFNANFIEDSVVVLFSELERDGHLRPEIVARVTLQDGERRTFQWRDTLGEPLPGTLRARRVHFTIHEGVRYHYRDLRFEGLTTIESEAALGYFVDTRGLLKLKANRVYTPGKAESSARALQEALERDGFQNATVVLTDLVREDVTGHIDLTVQVQQGKRFMVHSVRVEELDDDATNRLRTVQIQTNQPYSRLWLQDFEQKLVRRRYQEGFPDAKADITVLRSNVNDVVDLDLSAQVRPGPKVSVGQIRFLGQKETRESAMRARVPLKPGGPLDRTATEQGRFRLARLGVFDSVEMRYDVVNEQTRDVVYEVKEGKEYEFSLLAGFGSYELLRGGFILEKHNVWGLAHDSRLKAVQSFKSSSGEYLYTIPQFRWGSDLFFSASGLRRDEIDFTREELAASVGARRHFEPIATDASLRYSYQYVNAARADFVSGFGVPNARVAAAILDLRHDRRDNPITPRRGYKLFSNVEVASEALGGEVDYQRLELHGAYHWPMAKDRWLHFGAAHGAVLTAGNPEEDLPFNKRFFPGGDGSIRGYQEGEASPLNAEGKIVGAESYLGANLEIEQALTPTWSLVGFVDAMGVARDIGDYPFSELLFSAGAGLRWNTLIGPVRLEYGYNLHRRRHDPAGTLHISVGFPF